MCLNVIASKKVKYPLSHSNEGDFGLSTFIPYDTTSREKKQINIRKERPEEQFFFLIIDYLKKNVILTIGGLYSVTRFSSRFVLSKFLFTVEL